MVESKNANEEKDVDVIDETMLEYEADDESSDAHSQLDVIAEEDSSVAKEEDVDVVTEKKPTEAQSDHDKMTEEHPSDEENGSDVVDTEKAADEDGVDKYEHGQTPWPSIWLSYVVQMLTGIQFSIYFTSMWPYFTTLDPEANLSFFGWITSAYSIGQMASSWGFGYWNQLTMNARQPACTGLAFMAIGNILYTFLENIPVGRKWFMLVARLLVGFGSGNLIVLRTYCAMSSLRKDRTKVMSLAVGSWVLGLSLGPAIQAMFSPIGKRDWYLKFIHINMYTSPAILMVLISLISIVLLLLFFKETYSGVATAVNDGKGEAVKVPNFDRFAAYSCVYLWFMLQSVSTNIEVIATPFTISLYEWNDERAVLINGILQFVSCVINVINYVLISVTRVGRIDKRKLLIFSNICFFLYMLFTFPWPFFAGPLHYIPLENNRTTEDTSVHGGCFHRYTWCAHTTRVPFPLYVFSFVIILGFAFPFTSAPLGTLFSEILGPRPQGLMQGIFEFGACIARCVSPIVLTILFESTGYIWTTVMHMALLAFGMFLLIIFYRRMIPLKMPRRIDVAVIQADDPAK